MNKEDNKGIYRKLSPEQIDNMIKRRLKDLDPHTRDKGVNVKQTMWSEAEQDIRNGVVLDYIGKGLSARRVAEELCERWEISLKTAQRYYQEAIDSITKEQEEDVRKKYMERLERIAETCEKNGDMKTALKAQEQLNRISSFYTEKQQIEVEGPEIKFKFGN